MSHKISITQMDVIICLGRMLKPDNKLDFILRGRVEKAVELLQEYPAAQLILSGGKYYANSTQEISEAKAMFDFINDAQPQISDRCIMEDEGDSTITQLCRIKTEFLEKNSWKRVALVTDEVHLPRATIIIKSILGADYNLTEFASPFELSGNWRKLIEEDEKKKFDLTMDTRISKIAPGDHEKWLSLDKAYKEEKLRRINEKAVKESDTFTSSKKA